MSHITMTSAKKDLAFAWQTAFFFVLATVVIALPELALAGADTPIGNVFCTVRDWFTGNTGKGIATIAITIIGIGALLGKVSWGMAMIVGLGIAVVFGASGILSAFSIQGLTNPEDCKTNATWGAGR